MLRKIFGPKENEVGNLFIYIGSAFIIGVMEQTDICGELGI